MSSQIATQPPELDSSIVHSLVLDGDLGRMSPAQRVDYYVHRCRVLGIDPGEQPFQLVKLNGKLVMYATKTCANALTRVNGLSIEIKSTKIEGSLVIVEARATDRLGRFADDVGAIDLGEERLSKPNAIMKAVTKAKRRAVLSLVGLGVLDETEVDSIRGAQRVALDVDTGECVDAEIVTPSKREAPPAPNLGPRCDAGPGADLAEAIGILVAELARATGMADERKAFAGVLRRTGIDVSRYAGTIHGPESLTVSDGALVKAWIEGKLLEIATEVAVDERAAEVAAHFAGTVIPGQSDSAEREGEQG